MNAYVVSSRSWFSTRILFLIMISLFSRIVCIRIPLKYSYNIFCAVSLFYYNKWQYDFLQWKFGWTVSLRYSVKVEGKRTLLEWKRIDEWLHFFFHLFWQCWHVHLADPKHFSALWRKKIWTMTVSNFIYQRIQ